MVVRPRTRLRMHAMMPFSATCARFTSDLTSSRAQSSNVCEAHRLLDDVRHLGCDSDERESKYRQLHTGVFVPAPSLLRFYVLVQNMLAPSGARYVSAVLVRVKYVSCLTSSCEVHKRGDLLPLREADRYPEEVACSDSTVDGRAGI